MQNSRRINDDLYYIGVSDRRLALFENVYPIPRGVTYNSYVLLDEKSVLLDTADASVAHQFFENLEGTLAGKGLDYVVVNHVEPDHCALLGDLLHRHPEVVVVTNTKAAAMIRQFFGDDLSSKFQLVKEGDTLCTGRHTLHFVMAPMVHWPEVMVTYDATDRTLFAADAFGTFGALSGHLYADELDFAGEWLDDARRYYTNIVGKYGPAVQTLLGKAAALDIAMICPLHGPVWRKDLGWFIEKYSLWSRYEPEEKGVLVVYGSIYGNTESAADCLAAKLADGGVRHIAMYDVSNTHVSHLVSETFRYSHLVIAAPAYNGGIFTPMETFLADLKAHALHNRKAVIIENGTWAPCGGRLIREMLGQMKDITVLGDNLTIKSSLKQEQMSDLERLAKLLIEDIA